MKKLKNQPYRDCKQSADIKIIIVDKTKLEMSNSDSSQSSSSGSSSSSSDQQPPKQSPRRDVEANRGDDNDGGFDCSIPDWMKGKVFLGIGGCLLITGVILMIILLPLSFAYIEYNEIAFKKNTISNRVDTSEVYANGRHMWGPAYDKIAFTSTYQLESFSGTELSVFSSNGLDFPIEVDVYYKLEPENLALIFDDVGTAYEERLRALIESSLKNTATKFEVDDYVTNRTNITQAMYDGLNVDLAELFISIEPYKFLLKKVAFPDDVDQVFLNTAVQELENEKALLEQDVALTIRETNRLIEEIDGNITVVTVTAEAEAEAIVNIAQAEAGKIIQEATGVGINYMFTVLNITQAEERQKLFELFAILDNKNGVQILSGNINPLVNV